jgi:phosphoesterase RecJ-like protein
MESLLEELPWALLDHHKVVKHTQNKALSSGLLLVDVEAPSTTFLVLRLIEALGLEPTREEAEYLFFGLCTDTGFFRHIDTAGAVVFETAARLVRLGASPKAAFGVIHGGKSFSSRRLLGHLLVRADSFFGGRLILSTEEYNGVRRSALDARDSDGLFQLFQSVAGVEVVVVIRQEGPKDCTVAFRSRDWVDVGAVAESFGGGGHKNAAGLKVAGALASVKSKIIKAFQGIFST